MEPKKIALLIGAVVVALVTALLARQMFVKSATPMAVAAPVLFSAPTGPKVLVATRALPIGTILDDASFKYQPWPKDLVQGAYYIEGNAKANPNTLRGSVVRVAVSAGQPVTMGSVVQPGDRGFLAAALGTGMRAVTVNVQTDSGVAGFVFPGDRVDLMLTSSVDSAGNGPPMKTAETIVRNLRVLATDQRISADDKDGKKAAMATSSVTLEVTPRMAEKIAVARKVGELSLTLRPIAETSAELEKAIAAGTIDVPKGSDPKAEQKMIVSIPTQPADTQTTFVTGGDVSRFQRRNGGGATGGPVVHVARGNAVTDVPIGGK